MLVDYMVRFYDTDGIMQAVLDMTRDVRSLVIEHRVNHVSTLTLGLYGQSPVIDSLVLDGIIEVRRRIADSDPPLDWYTEYVGFHRTPQDQITTTDTEIYTTYSRGLVDLLDRRSVRYYADTAGSDKGPAPADDVMKEYVYENAGAGATLANGRLTAGVTVGLDVAVDTSEAADYSGANAYKNLLQTVRELGEPLSVDFDVVWGGEDDPITFTFVTYYPQLGTDRREGTADPMIFAVNLNNMENPSFTQQRTEEVTSCLVLGPGEGPLRDTLERTSTHIADSPWNVREQDQNASNEDTTAGLEAVGDGVLYEKRPAISVSFQPIQTAQAAYGVHYFLGDLVTAKGRRMEADVKIRAVTLNLSEEGETIGLELEEIPAA